MTVAPIGPERRRRVPPPSTAWRLPVLIAVVLVLAVAGLAAGSASTAPPPASPLAAARVAPADAVSSSWYCTGGSGASGVAPATLSITNLTAAAVTGTVSVSNDKGQRAAIPVTVDARGQASVVPAQIEHGDWLAAEVDMDGGGVAVTQVVHGPGGWAEAPCATASSSQWFFASGSTAPGDALFVSVFNPTTATAVVDLSFSTSTGQLAPQPFQGLVLAPGSLVVAQVASFVQDRSAVATVVRTRSGAVVASELQQHTANKVTGLSLRLGAPAPERSWYLPRSVHVSSGATSVVVFNPTAAPESVQVSVRLASGPVSPFTAQVAPMSTWVLQADQESRIPPNVDFATEVTARGGPGVVVDRVVTSAPGGPGPQWGAVPAVPISSVANGPGRWVVANPAVAVAGKPAVAGSGFLAVALQNVGSQDETVRVEAVQPQGPALVAGLAGTTLAPGGFLVVTQSALQAVGAAPVVVSSTGPLAVAGEAVPAGMPGVVAQAGLPAG